jgi:hypothetical protein
LEKLLYTRPFDWQDMIDKFKKLTADLITEREKDKIIGSYSI